MGLESGSVASSLRDSTMDDLSFTYRNSAAAAGEHHEIMKERKRKRERKQTNNVGAWRS
jgi:hypothetical protein